MKKAPVALQLYTVRDALQTDFPGTLKAVADLGYKAVELAGTGGYSAAELKKLLDDVGLKVIGSHVGLDLLEGDLQAALDYNEAIGNRYVVCPYLDEQRRKTGDDWKRMGERFNSIGSACRSRAMVFAYHNHAFEFQQFDGKTGMEILWEATDPELVKSELDVYWVLYGGKDPAAYIRELGRRVALLHVKDMARDAERSFAEVGEGIVDWNAVLEACEGTGVAAYIVEQDVCKRPPLESAAISLKNLQRMGLA
jgi:sugar phosphate isomerase/epimerase